MRSFKRGNRDSGPSEMFDAVCDDCGRDCRVPFRPTGSKPIYCSKCFENHDNDRPQRRDSGFKKEMFSTVCDECGKNCEVPFKPSSDKPVYCSRCFDNVNSRNEKRSFHRESHAYKPDNSASEMFQLKEQLRGINEKLEKILSVLDK